MPEADGGLAALDNRTPPFLGSYLKPESVLKGRHSRYVRTQRGKQGHM